MLACFVRLLAWLYFKLTHCSDEFVVGRLNPSVERPAPPLPTPVSFPDITFLKDLKSLEWNSKNKPNLFDLRLKWQYPPHRHGEQSLGLDVFRTINVQFEQASDFESLFSASNSSAFVPPKEWATVEPNAEQRRETKCRAAHHVSGQGLAGKLFNGRPWPTRGDFWERASQLQLSNIDGFRGYARIQKHDEVLPRVTHARPFFEHLDCMVQYWDTSLDEYIPPRSAGAQENDGIPRKRTKLSPDNLDSTSSMCEPVAPLSNLSEITSTSLPLVESVTLAEATITMRAQRPNTSRRTMPGRRVESSQSPLGTYRGWRIDCGKNMPNGTRDLLVKALLEIAMWPFGYHVDTAERQPARAEIQTLRVGVPLTRRIWRPPTDRIEAKMGIVYGPVLGMSARPMTGFDEKKIFSEVDLLREFGTLLLLAQERHRVGRKEKKAGEGAWWNEKPRWAGMPYEVPGEYPGLYFAAPTKDESSNIRDGSTADQSKSGEQRDKKLLAYTARREKELRLRREILPSNMTARQKSIHSYKIFSPSMASWDSKARYVPIGKDPESCWDEVSPDNF